MLAFAFIATIGNQGLITVWLLDAFGIDIFENGIWLYQVPGLLPVYLYFQVPLMVITFMPALEGLKPQWAEANATLGGTRLTYWTRIAVPVLAPSFFGSLLLLFANAFSSYATAAALISQGSQIVPLQIRVRARQRDRARPREHGRRARPRHDRRDGRRHVGLLGARSAAPRGGSDEPRSRLGDRAGAARPPAARGDALDHPRRRRRSCSRSRSVAMLQFTFRDGLGGGLHPRPLDRPVRSRRTRAPTASCSRRSATRSCSRSSPSRSCWCCCCRPWCSCTCQFPRLKRVLEFICIIPITVPAIVLVVGLAPVYSVVVKVFGSSVWTLAFAYGITVLPVRLPRDPGEPRRRPGRHAQRGGPLARRRLAHRARPRPAAEPASRRARRSLHLGRRRARRVHHREPAQPPQPADRAAADRRSPIRGSP